MLVTPGYERVKATDRSNTFKVNNKVLSLASRRA